MNRRHFFWITLWILLGLNACATLRPPGPAQPDTAKACADWRWIGISRAGARCPEVPGWSVRPLFSQVAPAEQREECTSEQRYPEPVPSPEIIRELSRFCVYEPQKDPKKLPFPPSVSTDLVRFDQDCAALSVSATEKPAEKNWTSQYEKFLEQAGKPATPLEINNRLGVRLAFLDTQPTGEGVPNELGNSPHGYTLAHLSRQLVCTQGPDEHCAAQITTRLAMPIIRFNPEKEKRNEIDTIRGGFLGMQSDLAEAIRNEVDDWRQAKQQKHLVLNLSMAWDGDLFGGLDEQQIGEMKAGTQAVYRSLQYAAGFDVLVLAAAGNQKREPCANAGPLLPAAWERGEPAQSCGVTQPAGKPLLYAVGGVRSNGQPLMNARHGGMPVRAAYGENAVVPSSDAREPTTVLTGSSVSTAVVSSIAAIVWDTRPDLDSHGVMATLARSGDPLSFKADFWTGATEPPAAPFPTAYRVSLCKALKQACDENLVRSASCPVRDCAEWSPEYLPDPGSDKPFDKPVLGACQPWLYPQPEDPPCAACVRDPPPAR